MRFPLRGIEATPALGAGEIPALTVHQPWAECLVRGIKLYETRGWGTAYRGPMAIHAGKAYSASAADLCYDLGMADLPLGAVIGIVELIDCIHMTAEFIESVRSGFGGEQEIALGYFASGRWAWRVADPRRIEPEGARGQLGLWKWMAK